MKKGSVVFILILFLCTSFRGMVIEPPDDKGSLEYIGKEFFAGYVTTTKDTRIIRIPINSNFERNNLLPYIVSKPGEGIRMGIEGIYSFKDRRTQVVYRYAILPHVTNVSAVMLLELDWGFFIKEEYVPFKIFYSKMGYGMSSESTYFAGRYEVYFNKIHNIIVALGNINDYQKSKGPFSKGQEYSYLKLINISDVRYLDGKGGSNLGIVRGSGICSMSTLLSETLFYTVKKNGGNISELYIERWIHTKPYVHGPFSSDPYESDATVLALDDKNLRDLRWIQPVNGYLDIDIKVKPNGLQEWGNLGDKSPYDVVVTLSFSDDPDVVKDNTNALSEAWEVLYPVQGSEREKPDNIYFYEKNLPEGWRKIINTIYP